MLEAKDTVMSLEQCQSYGGCKHACQAQAEITWNIAYRLGHTNGSYKGEEEGVKEGRQDVVEWVSPRLAMHKSGLLQTNIDYIEWQDKLKSWTIDTCPERSRRIEL